MRKPIPLTLILTLLLCMLTACTATGSPAGDWYAFTDDAGSTVTLAAPPETVAVLTSSFAEIWQLAGGEVAVTVGEAVERGFADSGVTLVDEGAGKSINTELLIAAKPDLVIVSSDIPAQAQTAQLLRSAGIPAAQLRVESFDDYLRVLKICTDITGNADAYRLHGTEVQAQIRQIFAEIPRTGEKPQILFVRAGSSEKSTKAKTAAEHFACVMLDELGSVNIADAAPVLIDGLSIEEILTADPAIIFVTAMGDEAATKANFGAVLDTPAWQGVRAVQEGRVHWLPKELFQYKPNARWAEAYRMLAEILYEE